MSRQGSIWGVFVWSISFFKAKQSTKNLTCSIFSLYSQSRPCFIFHVQFQSIVVEIAKDFGVVKEPASKCRSTQPLATDNCECSSSRRSFRSTGFVTKPFFIRTLPSPNFVQFNVNAFFKAVQKDRMLKKVQMFKRSDRNKYFRKRWARFSLRKHKEWGDIRWKSGSNMNDIKWLIQLLQRMYADSIRRHSIRLQLTLASFVELID